MLRKGAVFMLATISLLLVYVGNPGGSQADATDPESVVEDLFAEWSAGNGPGVAALVSEDVTIVDIGARSFGTFGRHALQFLVDFTAPTDVEITIVDIAAEGDTVTGVLEWRDTTVTAGGVDRYIQPFTIVLTDAGLVSRIVFEYDTSDAETAEFLEYLATLPRDADVPAASVVVPLGPGRDGNQPGTARLVEADDVTLVAIDIAPGPAGVQQPAHLHEGGCPGVGAINSPLADVVDGFSLTLVSVSLGELQAGEFAINVHQSAGQSGLYTACGEIGVELTDATPAPAETPTRVAGVVAPSTGTGGNTDAQEALLWLLAGAGALLVAGGVAARKVRNNK